MVRTISCRCGQVLAVSEEHVGKTMCCPVCQVRFTIRDTGKPAPRPVPPTAMMQTTTAPPAPPATVPTNIAPGSPAPAPGIPTVADVEILPDDFPGTGPPPLAKEPAELDQVEILPDNDEADRDEIRLRPEETTRLSSLVNTDMGDGNAYRFEGEAVKTGTNFSRTGHLGTIRLRGEPVECLAFGSEQPIALAAEANTLSFLDLKTMTAQPTPPGGHRAPITCLALAPHGLLALSGDAAGALLLWDVAQRRALRWLTGHGAEITCAALSPSGWRAISGDRHGIIRLWDLSTGAVLPLQQAHWDETITSVSFSANGRKVLAVGHNGKGRLWRVRSGEISCRLKRGADGLDSAALSSDDEWVVASSGAEFTVNRWRALTGERQVCFVDYAKNKPRITRTFVAPNGRAILALGFVPKVRAKMQVDTSIPAWSPLVVNPAALVIGKVAASVGSELVGNALEAMGNVTPNSFFLEFWEVQNEIGVSCIQLGPREPVSLACSADGHKVLAGFNGTVKLFGL
jgi:hypothetical protein